MRDSPRRVLLLTTPSSYRTQAFLQAAERLHIETLVVEDTPEFLRATWHSPFAVDFSKLDEAVDALIALTREFPVRAIVPVDDAGTVLAALVASRVGLPSNDPDAALAARDKWVMRQRFAAAAVPAPIARAFPALADLPEIVSHVTFPCVVKPTRLSGSRGVIRADDPEQLAQAVERVRQILASDGLDLANALILVEQFVPGFEVAVEGLLTNGTLTVLAIFDKPDPLDGPFFEETIYVTPSRLPQNIQHAIAHTTEKAAKALGLRTGPIHAELRVNERGPWVIEIAGRSIGGLCSRILEFGTGMTLEELILAHAVGDPLPTLVRRDGAAGVMMIPIPGRGILKAVDGIDAARAVPGIVDVEITAKRNHRIVPLPEGASYLGFIFARGETPDAVEAALRLAHSRLAIRIVPEVPLQPVLQ
ncbi:ATP-grasp domain-containing protein [Thermomicrobium sp. 4228-Ro]|uniref:ATP-grasp domain-containing protein n=1 Tax=Thermomicrobium sp. 4228-Ro TaxID=2993937 RepID=UPI0022499D03|nr:ATP-grasp domain-containing protein [Thermomicrobium sp. 4228-Ro]MCX2725958.1 ATP-grasp domain-containing protein [Thermomicrobium sp. 4228-Ro]